ncbi:Cell division protein FtsN [Saezia sanguinis]|jgi:cell division protein FtsN|uniref:Cell division protein FtsN n=2 Tax=Saezia sanguinis TaxID=1965230 RepID=A0A433SES7_9BURK|nr:Cell division protein FtsN [Saezia sanguinis]
MQSTSIMIQQRGLSLIGFILGLVLGLIIAAGVAFYITKTPVPFADRYSQQEPLQVPSDWNPNRSLQPQGGPAAPEQQTPPPLPETATTPTDSVIPAPATTDDPVAIAALGGAMPSGNERVAPSTTVAPEGRPNTPPPEANMQFYVQAGAFASPTEAEQQRARLALLGNQAVISQVTAAGRTIHRVRLGPYSTREAASIAQRNLASNNIDAAIVLVQQ